MHELGHNLNLHHGGDDDEQLQAELRQRHELRPAVRHPPRRRRHHPRLLAAARRARRLDVAASHRSRPSTRTTSTRTIVLDAADNRTGSSSSTKRAPRSRTRCHSVPTGTATRTPRRDRARVSNIDDDGSDNGRPEACDNDDRGSTLTGADDWTVRVAVVPQFGDSTTARSPEPTTSRPSQDLQTMRRALNTTDLALTLTDSPDPVAAGTDLTYTSRSPTADPTRPTRCRSRHASRRRRRSCQHRRDARSAVVTLDVQPRRAARRREPCRSRSRSPCPPTSSTTTAGRRRSPPQRTCDEPGRARRRTPAGDNTAATDTIGDRRGRRRGSPSAASTRRWRCSSASRSSATLSVGVTTTARRARWTRRLTTSATARAE